MRPTQIARALAAAALITASAAGAVDWPPPAAKPPEVLVTKADALAVAKVKMLPAQNPFDEAWKQAPYVAVPLLPQQIAMPMLPEPTIPAVNAQALHDGKTIAFRVQWDDATPDGNVETGRFSDAVAVQFPIDVGAAPMMGNQGARVQILYWKALWQKDIDAGFQDVQALYPNFWNDVYWFGDGKHPFPADAAFKNPAAMQWFVALSAGNPVSAISRTQPVQELFAAGWGSLTAQEKSDSAARGVWVNNTWTIIFTRPLTTADALDHQFKPGTPSQAAFAVWQGSTGNAGGRKHWSNWIPYEIK